MTDFLEQMAASSRARAERLSAAIEREAASRDVIPLSRTGFDLIAELKDRSPAEGALAGADASRIDRAHAYAVGGAAAISVLTEPDRFSGSLDHLAEVVGAVNEYALPVMRKDFLVATRQLFEARAAGASGVLLIAAILDDESLASMLDCAAELDLFVLLESFDRDDLARSTKLLDQARYAERAAKGELLIGINTRNLRTLAVDGERLERLAPQLPAGSLAVAESGIVTPDDAARVAALGYSLGLVGTALMKSRDPGGLVADMLAAARAAKAA